MGKYFRFAISNFEINQSWFKKSFFFFLEQQEPSNEIDNEERTKLLTVKSLLLKYMGDTNIPEKKLVKIVDLLDELDL